ncbi:hypothetical protein PF010_g17271 [Phytophthora fragariae]|uniref:Uncharacterized protein n=1 Tax=Phytophthora fragariae TaxID=53985 RepID=A0A6A3JME2_9STRA|nr:hypothetical protein PF011_g17081 [Phytophthora fragariae]KAE9093995.1 hypothetical protein PF010_g17271 [Phytophthora fragariae]KAE9205498.1 hypothetical protein PF004_g17566 [Phytophthora fragariae]
MSRDPVPDPIAQREPSPSRPTPPRRKSKKKKTSSTTKKSRGWGPFQSVLKERSVDFNLTLDVQNLQQQVRDLITLRDVLSTRSMLQRHSPNGSLFHVVKEYFHVFRTGWAVQESGRKRLVGEQHQRQFLHSVMDPEVDVDVDNGLRGPDVMAEQIIMYSTFIKFIRTTLQSYDIVAADDSIVIKTHARLRFQVLRKTIEKIFPHVIGDECLVAQLVGQEVEPAIGLTFFFNSDGKCCRYEMDMDFVGAFASIVKDPVKLEILLGRALIAENCMFGVLKEPRYPQIQAGTLLESALEDERSRLVGELEKLRNCTKSDAGVLHGPSVFVPTKVTHIHNDALFQRIVDDYYLVFENGYRSTDNQEHVQADFISQIFVPSGMEDPHKGGKYVQTRWRVLCECFDVLEFKQTSVSSIEYNDQEDMCVIRSRASYTLQLTLRSLELVFPHVLSNRSLVIALAGSLIVVPSQLMFTIETETGLVAHVEERMDFVGAIAALLQNREAVSFVMSQAQLSLDGVSCFSPYPVTPILSSPPQLRREKWQRVLTYRKSAQLARAQ